MLKLNYGKIGNKGFAALELEERDYKIIEELSKKSTSYIASNRCGLSYIDILNGNTCKPCTEEEFKKIEVAVEEFNSTHLSLSEVEKLRAENEKLRLKLDKIVQQIIEED